MFNAVIIRTQSLPWTIMWESWLHGQKLALIISLTRQRWRLVDWLNSLLIYAYLSDRLYHFICSLRKKNLLGQPQRRLPILLINPEPAGLKSNQNKHLTTENVKTCKLVIFSCLVREGFCVLSSSGAAVLRLWSKGSE